MVKDKSSLAVFKDYNPTEDLRKPPSKAGSSPPAAAPPAPTAAASPTPAPIATPPPSPPSPQPAASTQPASSSERIFASPLARKLASEKGIDLGLVQGTGPENQIRSQDILNFLTNKAASTPVKTEATPTPAQQQKQQQQASTGLFADISLNNFRSVTAKRLLFSKQTIPHYYLTCELELDNALK